jgi:hypothetical protein
MELPLLLGTEVGFEDRQTLIVRLGATTSTDLFVHSTFLNADVGPDWGAGSHRNYIYLLANFSTYCDQI